MTQVPEIAIIESMLNEDEGLLDLAASFALLALGLAVVLKLLYFPIAWATTGSFRQAGEMLVSSEGTEAFVGLIVGFTMMALIYYLVIV